MEDTTFFYCANQSVAMSASLPDSTLNKKSIPLHTTLYVRVVKKISGGVEGLVQMKTLQT